MRKLFGKLIPHSLPVSDCFIICSQEVNPYIAAIMQSLKYYLAATTAFIIWGFFSFVLKPLSDYGSLDILFYRVFLVQPLCLSLVRLLE